MSKRTVLTGYGLVYLLVALPVLLYRYPKMVDYPSHLARYYFQQVLPDHPILNRFFTNEWALIPNLGADILAYLSAMLLPVYDSGRLMILIAMALYILGIMALHHAVWGRLSLWPAFAALFIFNGNFAWGFMNYHVSGALVLLGFAGWIHMSSRHWMARIVYGTVVALVIYVGHLFALGAYGLLVSSYELGRARAAEDGKWKALVERWLVGGIPFIAPGILFLDIEASHGILGTVYGGADTIVMGMISSVGQFSLGLDTGLFVAVALFLYAGLRRGRWLKLAPSMIYPLVAVTLFSLIMPKLLLGIYLTNYRLPFLLFILLVVSCRLEGSERTRRVVAAVAMVLLLVRVGAVTVDWKRHGEEVAELRAAFPVIEQGAAVFPALGHDYESYANYLVVHHSHTLSYLTIDRAVFLPTLFTGSQMTGVRPEYDPMDEPQTSPRNLDFLTVSYEKGPFSPERRAMGMPVTESESLWWTRFDYLFVLYPPDQMPKSLLAILTPVHKGSFFQIFRIEKPR